MLEIRRLFRQFNARFDELSQKVETLFFQLRTDLADAQLDEINSSLARIQNSYADYVEAYTLNITEVDISETSLKTLQSSYKETFR